MKKQQNTQISLQLEQLEKENENISLHKDQEGFHQRLMNKIYSVQQKAPENYVSKALQEMKKEVDNNHLTRFIQTNINLVPQSNEEKQFFLAVKNNDISGVKKLLLNNLKLVNAIDAKKKTALHWAMQRKYMEMTKLLFDFRIDYEWKDITGKQALDYIDKGTDAELYKIYKINELICSN